MSAPTQEAIFGAVEVQRGKLLNVLSVVQCVRVALDGSGTSKLPELAGAVQLLEDAIQDVCTGLDEPVLLRRLEEESIQETETPS